ncbi:MAG: riboflavin synthase [Saprospiraceae bacterium]|nr:riboflavin synthase [Saprospiraceae bacterium]
MFTGIITLQAKILELKKSGTNLQFTLSADLPKEIGVNDSIAHDGVCLTLIQRRGRTDKVEAIQETLKISTLSEKNVGDVLNLEVRLKMNQYLHGHIVQGHVDGKIKLQKIITNEGSHNLRFGFQKKAIPFILHKGSICINGVSLTVSKVNYNKRYFEVSIIPHTWTKTNLSKLTLQEKANVEYDLMLKYLHQMQKINIKN